MKLKLVFPFLLLPLINFANDLNNDIKCKLDNPKHIEICKELIKQNIDIKYINDFLNRDSSKKIDKRTLKYINPKKIKYHRKQEMKANNSLVKYIPTVVKHLNKYKDIYDIAEKKFKVNREIIAAILLKETRLGKIKPSFDAFTTLNTVYLKIEPNNKRNKWLHNLGRNSIISLISYCYKNNISIKNCQFKSSYIGGVGISQFIPSSFIYIYPYNRKYSTLEDMPSAILSTANYLHQKSKWNKLFNFKDIKNMPEIEKEWYEFNFKNPNSSFVNKKNRKCYSCDKPNLKELSIYINKIMKYNNSSNYAVGVFRIAWSTNKELIK